MRSALLCLVAFAMALAAGPVLHLEASSTRIQLLRLYGILIASVLMLVETESPWVLERMRILESWVGRALLQGLVCCMMLELATSEGDTDFDMSIRLYRQVGWIVILNIITSSHVALIMQASCGLLPVGMCQHISAGRNIVFRNIKESPSSARGGALASGEGLGVFGETTG